MSNTLASPLDYARTYKNGQVTYELTPWAEYNRMWDQTNAVNKKASTDKIMSSWQSAYDSAKNTNLERYEDILKGYQDRYGAAMQGLQGLGDAEKADLQRAYAISGSHQQQGLVNAGLSSTTIRPAVQQQNTSAMQRAMSLVNERLQHQQLGMQNQLSGDTLAFKERREDEYPNMQYYLELLKQASAA